MGKIRPTHFGLTQLYLPYRIMYRVLFILFVGLTQLNVCFSQNLSFVKYGRSEGLNHSQIFDIAQDANDNLWLTTASYFIYRFDGREFFQHRISLANYYGRISTYKIIADDQSIWILTNLGLVKYDGKKYALVPMDEKPKIGFNSKLILDHNKRIWICDEAGEIFRMESGRIKKMPEVRQKASGPIAGFYRDTQLVFFSKGGVTVHVDDNQTIRSGKLDWLPDEEIFSILQINDVYYVGLKGKIIRKKDRALETIPLPPDLSGNPVQYISKDRNGIIWIHCGGSLCIMDEKGIRKVQQEDFTGNLVFSVFKDRNQSIWVATDGEGIFNDRNHALKKLDSGKDQHIMSMAFLGRDSTLIMGTYNAGLLGLDNNLLPGKMIISSYVDDSEVLLGTYGSGLYRLKDGVITSIPISEKLGQFIGAIRKQGNTTFVGSLYGLHIIDGSSVKSYALPGSENSGSSAISTIYISGKSIILGCEYGGIQQFVNGQFRKIGPDHLAESSIYGIHESPQGDIFVTGEFSSIEVFNQALEWKYSIRLEGVVSNILFIEFIDKDQVLVGSNEGVFRLGWENREVKSVKKYGKMDGYGDEEVYVNSSLREKSGAILFGTVKGAYRITFSSDQAAAAIPKTYLTDIRYPEQPYDTIEGESGYFGVPKKLVLPTDFNSVTASFSATDLENPYNIQFHYRLVGLEEKWSPVGSLRQVTYSKLSPGEYEFQVQAIGESKIWGSIASLPVVIVPGWWQTRWFYFGLAGVIAGVTLLSIWVTSSYRVRQLQLREKMRASESVKIRKQMSMDFHDEMGNKLASMLAQASLLKLKYKEGELYKVFDFFERNAFSIYHGTKDFIWTIDVSSNSLKEVISYLSDFGFSFFERNSVGFHVTSDPLDSNYHIQLEDGQNRHIILIFKEAMTNILKHAKCKNVYFAAYRSGKQFVLQLRDDGIWVEPSNGGKGLRNMQLRASKIGGTLHIDKNENGTIINLSFDI